MNVKEIHDTRKTITSKLDTVGKHSDNSTQNNDKIQPASVNRTDIKDPLGINYKHYYYVSCKKLHTLRLKINTFAVFTLQLRMHNKDRRGLQRAR